MLSESQYHTLDQRKEQDKRDDDLYYATESGSIFRKHILREQDCSDGDSPLLLKNERVLA
jgi:hypothetical protein